MIVIKCGVREILKNAKDAHAEMRTAAHLFNRLVAVERWRRKEYSTIRSRYVPGLGELEEAYEQLSDWIGAFKGAETSKRGVIRRKRQIASAPKHKGGPAKPTRQVDAAEELSDIEIMKQWRKAASDAMKPLRAEFAALLGDASVTYEARTCGVEVERIKERNRLREIVAEKTSAEKFLEVAAKVGLREAHAALKTITDEIDAVTPATHKKKAANKRVLAEMLEEPWPEAWKDCARLDDVAYKLVEWIGTLHNLNHGTYEAVQRAVEAAGKRPPPRPDSEPRKPKQRPAFSRRMYRKMGWQIQKSMTWGGVMEGKCRDLHVSDVRPHTGDKQRMTMSIRITQPNGEPATWVDVAATLPRPIPEDTKLTWVYLVPEERPGNKIEYSVQLTVQPTAPLIERAVGAGHVHVALRWTQSGRTLNVADINGKPLLLPVEGKHGLVEKLRYAESCRGYSDDHFNTAREELAKRLSSMPQDIQDMCKNLPHWKRHEKLRRVANALAAKVPGNETLPAWNAWRDARLRQKLDLFAPYAELEQWMRADASPAFVFACWLEAWRRKDEHLEHMAEGTKRRALKWRKDFYRNVAARLSEQYETCSLGGATDLAALALRTVTEDPDSGLPKEVRHNRFLAAPSELKEALEYVFGERMRDAPGTGGARSSEKNAGTDAEEPLAGAAE